MSQLYLQRFEYRGAISKAEFDQAWGAALETFARSNNWGGPRPACVTSRLMAPLGVVMC